MSQVVPTNGFIEPPAGNTPPPASQQQPGWVPNPGGAPAPAAVTPQGTPAQNPAPAPAAAPDAMQAAIQALTAAMQSQAAPAPGAQPNEPNAQVPATNLNSYDVGSIDDPVIKSMATVLQTVGKDIDLDRALGKAIEDGRADLIDVAYLREKGGANADQLITIAQSMIAAIEAKSAQVTASVHSLAGGEANWSASVAAFNTGAPQELRMVVAQMLDSHQESMIKAGAKLVVEFGKSSGKVPNVNPSVQGGAAGMPSGQALSKEAFQAELRKLNPNTREFQSQRAELFSRRQLGRNLGM